jgi:chemotaxis family two-component system response regulator Rcp1
MTQPFEILLVEDNEGDVEMFRRALKGVTPPCNLSLAKDGSEALDFLFKRDDFRNAARPHLLFLDLNMPGMDGKEALKAIKSSEHLRAIPVAVFTSSNAPADIKESYSHHANCYIVKPFDSGEYKSAIKEVVNFWRNLAVHPPTAANL